MPPKRAVDVPKDTNECILRYGKSNNVIQWSEEMQTAATALYGLSGMFFSTNRSHVPPRVNEEEILQSLVDSEEEEEDDDEEEDDEPAAAQTSARPVGRAAARVRAKSAKEARREAKAKTNEKLISKLREGAYESRRKAIQTVKDDERKIWPMMWVRMSPASQCRVREEEDFEDARLNLDCVRLWTFIRETHLTHIFGVGDPQKEVNALEQQIRFAGMKQGEREYISTFKTRFDHQVKANEGAGIPPATDRKLALEFIMKLDAKRYKTMLWQMRNDSLRNDPEAYPSTLAGAFRIAAGWTNEDPVSGAHGIENNSAYLTDACFVTKARDPEKGGTKSSATSSESKSRKKAEIVCFVCGKSGHYARDCSQKKGVEKVAVAACSEADEKGDEAIDEWDVALVASYGACLFSKYEILLDNQASLNVFGNKDLLSNLRKAEVSVRMTGIELGAKGVKVDRVGDFADLGEVYFSENASANVLSFAQQVNSGAKIEYRPEKDEFRMRSGTSGSLYVFARKDVEGSEGRFYTCDVRRLAQPPCQVLVQTVDENMGRFTKREVQQAKQAMELLARMGFPSVADAISMLGSGTNFDVSARDFQIAESIWGMDRASLQGKTTKKASPVADVSIQGKVVQQQQILSVDIMFVDKIPFLVGVATPLDLTIVTSLLTLDILRPSRAAEVVKRGITYFLAVLASQHFTSPLLMSDGEGAIAKIQTELNGIGVEVDISGAGGHVARVERRIRVIKERVRTHIHHLPYTLSQLGLSMCVLYCVSRMNFQHSSLREGGLSPREAFLGRKPDGKKDFRCAFGDYAVATTPTTDNSMKSRTEDCVVMLPTGNRTGSVRMMSLSTGKLVSRDHFKILPMPLSVIARMNELAAQDGRTVLRKLPGVPYNAFADTTPTPSHLPDYITPIPTSGDPTTDTGDQPQYLYELADDAGMQPHHEHHTANETVGGVFNPHDHSSDPLTHFQYEGENVEIGGAPAPEEEGEWVQEGRESGGDPGTGGASTQPTDTTHRHPTDVDRPTQPQHTRSVLDMFRNGVNAAALLCESSDRETDTGHPNTPHNHHRTGEQALNITVREAILTRGEEAERVIMKELSQMITKKVWTPVDGRSLTAEQRASVIRSSMFLKEKFFATGEFEKLKARLVAGGDQQDKDLYDDLSAPTVSTCSVFTILTIAAHEGRSAAVVDIGGTFLNAEMKTGVDVHMRLDRTISELMIRLDQKYKRYQDGRGCITVMLDRALYGCVESAALWYENLKETMSQLGYLANPYDICVFNRTNDRGIQCTATVHVDDLLIVSTDSAMIDALAEGLRVRYGEISKTEGTTLNYLGMVFDLSHPGEARVSIKGYVDSMLECSGTTGGARTPATEGLFHVRPESELLCESERKEFHSTVAKLLYLAKRARPDCLMPVAYLATRVTKCTKDDQVKLTRLMRYVRDTRDRGIVLRAGAAGIEVRVFIDAAYGVHADGKSHTGSCVVIGELGAVHCKSSKQQIVSKSSTEAELIALSDSANQALHTRNFLLAQGYKCGPAIVYQDNLSCMALIERGRSGAERTRHIDIRYFWLKERVETGEAIIRHMGTLDMYANLLTKPLQGGQFVSEREALTGWDKKILA